MCDIDAVASALRALAQQWRNGAKDAWHEPYGTAQEDCADELEDCLNAALGGPVVLGYQIAPQ